MVIRYSEGERWPYIVLNNLEEEMAAFKSQAHASQWAEDRTLDGKHQWWNDGVQSIDLEEGTKR